MLGASLVALSVNSLTAMQETWVGMIPWRRKWKPTPVFLPGESHGQWSLAVYKSQELDTIERLSACVRMHTHTHTHTHFVLISTVAVQT